jgi:hypothetical protein
VKNYFSAGHNGKKRQRRSQEKETLTWGDMVANIRNFIPGYETFNGMFLDGKGLYGEDNQPKLAAFSVADRLLFQIMTNKKYYIINVSQVDYD